MRILTFNLWHGLAPMNSVLFRRLEPTFRLKKREEIQSVELRNLRADIYCLQEVNPLKSRAEKLANVMERVAFYHFDSVGFKVAGFGWPPLINSGLLSLLPKSISPKNLKPVKMSGSKWSNEGSGGLAWQWRESRFALLSECLHPEWGRVLVVNCHLHHGLDLDDKLSLEIQSLVTDGQLTAQAANELKNRLNSANQRRETEIQTLLDQIQLIEARYGLIVLAGDFNFVSESEAYQKVIKAGYLDAWVKSETKQDGSTFDSVRNRASHIFTQNFPVTVESEDLSFSPKVRTRLIEILRAHERRPRRVDYVFLKTVHTEMKVKSAELVGIPQGDELAPSDHFGVLIEIDFDRRK